jgi:orotidine-5'-phosphate decarboxylase
MKPEIILALDVSNTAALQAALPRLPPACPWVKVGLELFCAAGPIALEPLKQRDYRIFLDLKLHDIPHTVGRAVTTAAQHGVHLLTVHASGGRAMLRAAAEAARATPELRLLAVTVLTSLDAMDLNEMGVFRPPAEQAVALAGMAYECGIHGVVCSLHEATAIRTALGPEALIVTPGIRLPGHAVGDQKRVGSPRDARAAGASHLVVGRPVVQAADPVAAYQALLDDLGPGEP